MFDIRAEACKGVGEDGGKRVLGSRHGKGGSAEVGRDGSGHLRT